MNRHVFMMAAASVIRFRTRAFLISLAVVSSVLITVSIHIALTQVRVAGRLFVERAYPAENIAVMNDGSSGRKLRLSDMEAVVEAVSEVSDWDPTVRAGKRFVKAGGRSVETQIVGYSQRAEWIRRRTVQDGRFFTKEDVRSRARVALIGSTTATALFDTDLAVGQQLFIDNASFEVIGILESIGADPHGNDEDDTVQVPYTTLMDDVLKSDAMNGAVFAIGNTASIQAAEKGLAERLRERFRIQVGQPDGFRIVSGRQMAAQVDAVLNALQVFAWFAVGLAFSISGIVIWMITALSVRERRSEFGLRKAVGARSRDLQLQVLLEAGVISVFAAVVGMIVALAFEDVLLAGLAKLSPVMGYAAGSSRSGFAVSAVSGLATMAIAVITTVLAALLPARKTARLNAIEALR